MDVVLVRGRCRGDARETTAALAGMEARERTTTVVADLTEHERLIADEQWFNRSRDSRPAPWPRRWRRRFQRALIADLMAAGLVDRERVSVVRDLRVAGAVTLGVGIVAWVVTATVLDELGHWPLAIPAGIVVSGLMLFIAATRFSILSDNGRRLRTRVLYSARVQNGRTTA